MDKWRDRQTLRRQTERLTCGQADRHTYGRPEERTDIKRKKKAHFAGKSENVVIGVGVRERDLLTTNINFTFNFRVFTL